MGGLCRQGYQLKISTRLNLILSLFQEGQHCGISITAKPHYGVSTTEIKSAQGRQKDSDPWGIVREQLCCLYERHSGQKIPHSTGPRKRSSTTATDRRQPEVKEGASKCWRGSYPLACV